MAFNNSDMFNDVPFAFLPAVRRHRHCRRDGAIAHSH